MGNNYGGFERSIALLLSRFPVIKKTIKLSYQHINYLIRNKQDFEVFEGNLSVYSKKGESSFFGYYDHTPENQIGTHILFHSTNNFNPKWNRPLELEICCLNRETGEILDFGTSKAANLQFGTRLQWIDQDLFAFNDISNGKNCTKIGSLKSGKIESTFDTSMQEVTKDFIITIDYNYLAAIKSEYGFFQNPSQKSNSKDISIYTFSGNKTEVIVSMDQTLKLVGLNDQKVHNAYFNHIMLSPDKERFIVIFRYYQNGKRFDKLLLHHIKPSTTTVLVNTTMVSHCIWKNNEEIIGYLEGTSTVRTFFNVSVKNGNQEVVFSPDFHNSGDGHPSIINQSNAFIFDSYPDRSGMQNIYCYSKKSNEVYKMAHFKSPMRFRNNQRCDLHPRVNLLGTRVFFDSTHEGFRRLYSLDLEFSKFNLD